MTESARFAGVSGLLSGDAFLTGPALRTDRTDDPEGARLWRTTTTTVDDAGVPSQTVAYHRVRGDVELAGEQTPAGVTAYEPALVELPADVGPGSAWGSSGSAGGAFDNTSSFHAAAGAGGCLEVSGELDLAADVDRTPAVGAGLVVVADCGGTLTALAAADGAPRWERALEVSALAVVGGSRSSRCRTAACSASSPRPGGRSSSPRWAAT